MSYTKLVLLAILLAISACSSPMTKESYLDQFREFISSVESSTVKESAEFWVQSQQQYERFTGEWYEKFKQELTWREELAIAQLQARYNLLRSAAYARDITRGARLEYAEVREQLQFYMENDMQGDINRMMETIRTSSAMMESEVEALMREFRAAQQPKYCHRSTCVVVVVSSDIYSGDVAANHGNQNSGVNLSA